MLTALANPLTLMVGIALTLAMRGHFLGQRLAAMRPKAIAGAVMFVVSSIAMNAWMSFDGLEAQLAAWRAGLILDAALYLFVLVAIFGVWWCVGLLIAAAGSVFYLLFWDVNPQFSEALYLLLIAGMAAACYALVPASDLIGRLLWGVLAIGEAAALASYVDCQFLHGRYGEERAEGSACAQVYGIDISMLSYGLVALAWLYILRRWFGAQK